jgi:stage II sporulation protein GA (sporulation sigma-E factor processing peptidase)
MIKYIESLKKDIKIKLLGNVFDLKALVDSGNMLKDPISKSDVVMVDFKVIKGILPDELVDLSRENLDMVRAQEILMELDTDLSRKIRLIPYKHAGSSEAKIVFGLKIDYLEVDNQKIDNIVIGFADIDDPDYGAIINPSLLQIT